MLQSYLPILVTLVVALGVAGAFTFLATALGPKRPTAEKALPYETGMEPISAPHLRSTMQFYRIAMLFLVFDIEAAFFYPWAVLFRDLSCGKGSTLINGICHGGTSAFGIIVMATFLAILLLALVFVWRKRALEWD